MPSILTRPIGGGGAGGSVDVTAYSDAGFTTPITSADIGDTIYLKAVSSNATPVEYFFAFEDSAGQRFNIYQGANDNTSWVVDTISGIGSIYAFATEDAAEPKDWVGNSIEFDVTGFEGLLDAYTNNNVFAVSQVALRLAFTDPLIRYRRSSDNAAGDFSRDNTVTPVRITDDSILSNGSSSGDNGSLLSSFVSATDAYVPKWYDQVIGGGEIGKATESEQPKSVSSGSIILGDSKPSLLFDGINDFLETTPPVSAELLQDSITLIADVTCTSSGSSQTHWYGVNPIFEIIGITGSSVNSKVPISVGIDNSKVYAGFAQNGITTKDYFTSTSSVSISTPVKIAVTVDVNTVKIYINGTLDSTHTITNSTGVRSINGQTFKRFYLGGRQPTGNRFFNGEIRTVYLCGEVLSQSQIDDINNNYI